MSGQIRFLLQSPKRTGDGVGGYQQNWQDECYLWGDIHSQTGAGGNNSGVKIDWQNCKLSLIDAKASGLRPGWRLYADGVNHEVIGIGREKNNRLEVTVRREFENGI